jgi:acyl transferase domain-containing protein
VALPTYPFEREYCWFDSEETDEVDSVGTRTDVGSSSQKADGENHHPFLDTHIAVAHPTNMHVWEVALDTQRLPYLTNHRIQGAMALPVSIYVEMAQAATVEAFGPGKHILAELELKKLLLLPEKGSQRVQVILSSDAHEYVSFHVYSHSPEFETQSSLPIHAQPKLTNTWTLHATGKIRHQAGNGLT